jgi:hypothetical protein
MATLSATANTDLNPLINGQYEHEMRVRTDAFLPNLAGGFIAVANMTKSPHVRLRKSNLIAPNNKLAGFLV